MGFKEVMDLDCETTTALGGINKATKKPNPTKIEGYFIGSKDTPSKRSRNGVAKLHILQTSKGNVGVWGKTDLDRKMLAVPAGCMIRITQSGTVPTPNGDMYKFKVEIDEENMIEVNLPTANDSTCDSESAEEDTVGEDAVEQEEAVEEPQDDEVEETPLDADEENVDEVPPTRPTKKAATPPLAANRAKVQELLNKRRAVK